MEHSDDIICKTFLGNPDINPRTGKKIIAGKKIYNDLVNLCLKQGYSIDKLLEIPIFETLDYKLFYLYELENNIDIPTSIYLQEFNDKKMNIDENIRIITIDWILEVSKYFHHNNNIFGLSITLFDNYISHVDVKIENVQTVAIICLHLSENILKDFHLSSIDEYLYMASNVITQTEFEIIRNNIFETLKGRLIRPSTVFFVDIENEKLKDLTITSYFSSKLIIYNPSLIAESINYLLSGTYKIYSIEEISTICEILTSEIERFIKSSLINVKNIATNAKSSIRSKCLKYVSIYKNKTFRYPETLNIDEYEELETIGEGGYGKITKIKSKKYNRDFVIKSSIVQVEYALIEISILKQLKDNYIIDIYGFKLYTNKVDIYLPYFSYSLATLIKENKFNLSKLAYYAKQIILGLQECHHNDIIHRDIKIDNIIYDENTDQFKLIDFGISVAYASFKDYLSPDIANSYQYRPPEILINPNNYNYNFKIDIWAVGMVLYYIITSKYIFNYDDTNIQALEKIFNLLGTPTNKEWAHVESYIEEYELSFYNMSHELKEILGIYYDLIISCFELNPDNRATTEELLVYIDYNY